MVVIAGFSHHDSRNLRSIVLARIRKRGFLITRRFAGGVIA
jgi:hypothetical protein